MPAFESKPDFSIKSGASSLGGALFAPGSGGNSFRVGAAGTGLDGSVGDSCKVGEGGLRAGVFCRPGWGFGLGLGLGLEEGLEREGWTDSSRVFKNLRLLSSSSVCAGPFCKDSRASAQRQTVTVGRNDTVRLYQTCGGLQGGQSMKTFPIGGRLSCGWEEILADPG